MKLDGPVEVHFVSVEDEDLFFALPFSQIPPSVTWKPNGLGWMDVPLQPLDKSDMVLLSNQWWVELRRSFDNAVQSVVQYQLFENSFLRLLIVPVQSEDVTRALILTNLPVVLSQLDSQSAVSMVGAKLLSHCMIFPPAGEFPATLDDIAYGSDEKFSVNSPDRYFVMPDDPEPDIRTSGFYKSLNVIRGMFSQLHVAPAKTRTSSRLTLAANSVISSNPLPKSCQSDNPSEVDPFLAKRPLPVLLRQTSNPSNDEQSSHLFPHQKRTVGWMMDIENGFSPPLFCPLANLFGSYYVLPYGVERTLLHSKVEVLRPKGDHLSCCGMIAHPVGSGKTIIVIETVRLTCHMGQTLICVPDHIVLQWHQEFCHFASDISSQVWKRNFKMHSRTDCLIVGHGDISIALYSLESHYHRLIIDEPQEIVNNERIFNCLLNFACERRWLLTATPQPLGLMMQLALGYEHNPKLRLASSAMEAWFVQTRCRRDPPTLCLPIPPMHISMKPVTLLWQETTVMHSYAMQDDLQTAIRLASFFHTRKAKSYSFAMAPGLDGARKFPSLAKWVQQRGTELKSQLLESTANVERINLIMSDAIKGVGSPDNHLVASHNVLHQDVNGDEEIDATAMQNLYEQYPGVPEELLLERERSMANANKMQHLLMFMDTVTQVVTASAECLICMNELGGHVVSMLPCLHSFCATCVGTLFRRNVSAQCPMCRQTVLRHQICTFLCQTCDEEQLSKEMNNLNISASQAAHIRSKFGSKVFAIATEIVRILQKNPEDKIVVFAQWTDLLEHISAAIPREVEHCLLRGSMEARCKMIEDFRLIPSLKVMLLSSESQASGANLEVANHVIIAHPYCPPHIQSVSSVPLAQAQAFEQQAVGRVLRFPQNKEVYLYRFYSLGTPEEELYTHWGWAGCDSTIKQGTMVG